MALYTAIASGASNAAAATVWDVGTPPTSGVDSFLIPSPFVVTFDVDFVIAVGQSGEVAAGATLVIANAKTLTNSGTLTTHATSTISTAGGTGKVVLAAATTLDGNVRGNATYTSMMQINAAVIFAASCVMTAGQLEFPSAVVAVTTNGATLRNINIGAAGGIDQQDNLTCLDVASDGTWYDNGHNVTIVVPGSLCMHSGSTWINSGIWTTSIGAAHTSTTGITNWRLPAGGVVQGTVYAQNLTLTGQPSINDNFNGSIVMGVDGAGVITSNGHTLAVPVSVAGPITLADSASFSALSITPLGSLNAGSDGALTVQYGIANAGTISGSGPIFIGGNLNNTGGTWSHTGSIRFTADATITSDGATFGVITIAAAAAQLATDTAAVAADLNKVLPTASHIQAQFGLQGTATAGAKYPIIIPMTL